jgi:hypothetical protein
LEFTAWEKLDPAGVTPEIRKRALRCHHIYDIKRDSSAKNRVVVNGSKQHSDTYTDTTSAVASQLQLRIFLAVTAFGKYDMIQLDLTNAYLILQSLTSFTLSYLKGLKEQANLQG